MLTSLWLKGWLETRSRLLFAALWSAGFLVLFAQVPPRGPVPEDSWLRLLLSVMALVWVFIPCWLAGTGVKTQSGFGASATKGLHGSTHFTLSLPVSRATLFGARTAVGFAELIVLVAILFGLAWVAYPAMGQRATVADALMHLTVVLAACSAIYGLAVLVATFVDDVLIMPVSTVVIVLLWTWQFVGKMPRALDLFSPLVAGSPLVTHTVPWVTLILSPALGAICLALALKVVERTEY